MAHPRTCYDQVYVVLQISLYVYCLVSAHYSGSPQEVKGINSVFKCVFLYYLFLLHCGNDCSAVVSIFSSHVTKF